MQISKIGHGMVALLICYRHPLNFSLTWGFHREHGEQYKAYIGPFPIVIISSTTAIDQFFKERPYNIRRSANTEQLFEDCNIAGLFSMEGM